MSASALATKQLPPDPEGLNDDRAEWAGQALHHFVGITGTERDDMVADLIGNIRHWCDRNGFDFERELARGWEFYEEETRDGNK